VTWSPWAICPAVDNTQSTAASHLPSNAPLLVLDAAARTYDGASKVRALLPTHLPINRGDYVGIVGPSGSGKSTLLNLLGLLDTPTGGRYLVGGVNTADLSEVPRTALRGNVFGFVFQAYHLMSRRTVLENVELGMVYKGLDRQTRVERSVEALDRVGIADKADSIPQRLSGGERQRVAIARALAARPEVLLCDEPTGNLDGANSGRLLDLLESLNSEGLTLVIVTHDSNIGARPTRLIEIEDGHAVERR